MVVSSNRGGMRISFLRAVERTKGSSVSRRERGERRAAERVVHDGRVVPESFPVLIGRWLVAGARHSPETRVGPRLLLHCRPRSFPRLLREASPVESTPPVAPPDTQRRIKTSRDLERSLNRSAAYRFM